MQSSGIRAVWKQCPTDHSLLSQATIRLRLCGNCSYWALCFHFRSHSACADCTVCRWYEHLHRLSLLSLDERIISSIAPRSHSKPPANVWKSFQRNSKWWHQSAACSRENYRHRKKHWNYFSVYNYALSVAVEREYKCSTFSDYFYFKNWNLCWKWTCIRC